MDGRRWSPAEPRPVDAAQAAVSPRPPASTCPSNAGYRRHDAPRTETDGASPPRPVSSMRSTAARPWRPRRCVEIVTAKAAHHGSGLIGLGMTVSRSVREPLHRPPPRRPRPAPRRPRSAVRNQAGRPQPPSSRSGCGTAATASRPTSAMPTNATAPPSPSTTTGATVSSAGLERAF